MFIATKLLTMGARNAAKNWRHSLAAVLSVAAGFATLTVFENYFKKAGDIYQQTYSRRYMLGDIMFEKHGAQDASLFDQHTASLSRADQTMIAGLLEHSNDKIDVAVRFLTVTGSVTNGTSNTVAVGFGHDIANGTTARGKAWAWNVNAGVPLVSEDRPVVLLGKIMGRGLGCTFDAKATSFTVVGNYPAIERPFNCPETLSLAATTDSGQANAITVRIAGISDAGFQEMDARQVVMPLKVAQSLLATDRISYLSVTLKDPTERAALVAKWQRDLADQGASIDVMDWRKHPFGDLYVRSMEYLDLFRGFIMAVIIVIAAMSTFNILSKNVTERTRDVGTMRSIGFRSRQIVLLFGFEGVALAAIGIALGGISAFVTTLAVNLIGIPYRAGIFSEPIPFLVSLNPGPYAVFSLFMGIVAATAAVAAAWQVSRVAIPEALAHI